MWIAGSRDLLQAPLGVDGRPGPPQIFLHDLPFNGRSNGTLTVTPTDHLLYETSGAREDDSGGSQAAPGSATLWELDPADLGHPHPLATGLKGAYAHAYDRLGRLWTTEIADDPVNGGAPPDELNLVTPGADFGWPRCFGAGEPALDYGGTAQLCAATVPAAAIFPAGATPVGITGAPWADDVLLVSLWMRGEVVQVQIRGDRGGTKGVVAPFVQGLANPQHLLARPDGSVWAGDFGRGVIYRIGRR